MSNQSALDVTDNIWDIFLFMATDETYKDTPLDPNLTWKDIMMAASDEGTPEWVLELGLARYLFEKEFFWRKPVRTMVYSTSDDVVDLFAVYVCPKHRFQVALYYSSERNDEGKTAICPYCNADNLITVGKSGHDEYIAAVGGKTLSKNVWDAYEKIVAWEQAYDRKENRKYKLKKWTEKGYASYRIKSIARNLFAGIKGE